jgi:hypothetical protein
VHTVTKGDPVLAVVLASVDPPVISVKGEFRNTTTLAALWLAVQLAEGEGEGEGASTLPRSIHELRRMAFQSGSWVKTLVDGDVITE